MPPLSQGKNYAGRVGVDPGSSELWILVILSYSLIYKSDFQHLVTSRED